MRFNEAIHINQQIGQNSLAFKPTIEYHTTIDIG